MKKTTGTLKQKASAAVKKAAEIRGRILLAALTLAFVELKLFPLLVRAGDPDPTDATAILTQVTNILGPAVIGLGAVMGGFGIVKIGTGVYADNADDKQKGVMACVGGAITVVAGGIINAAFDG